MQRTLSYYIRMLEKDFSEFCNKKLQKIGLTLGLMYFVIYIDKRPNCSPGQLAAALHYDIGHTARSLDRLERDGFVLREKKPWDKRAYHLCLTKKGEEAMLTIRSLLVEWDEVMLADISGEEQGELLRILAKLKMSNGAL